MPERLTLISRAVMLRDIARRLTEPWRPETVADVNEFQLKVVRLHGDFPWHEHGAEDELFVCLDGTFRIELEGAAPIDLGPGDAYVVPRGVRHRPLATEVAFAALLERRSTQQYGDVEADPVGFDESAVRDLSLQARWDDAVALLPAPDPNERPELALLRATVMVDRFGFTERAGDEMQAAVQQALQLAHRSGNSALIAEALDLTGMSLHWRNLFGIHSDAFAERAYFESALAWRHPDDLTGRSWTLFHLGLAAQVIESDGPRAQSAYEEALGSAPEDAFMLRSYLHRHIGQLALARGDLARAEEMLVSSLALREQLGFVAGIAAARVTLARLREAQGQRDPARDLYAAAVTTGEQIGAARWLLGAARDGLQRLSINSRAE